MITTKISGVVVVPCDFSSWSISALKQVGEMAEDARSIKVVHVATPLDGPDSGVLYAAAEKRNCLKIEKRFRQQIMNEPLLRNVSFHVIYGDVGIEVNRFAERNQAEMIVMPARKRNEIAKLFFRSPAESVVRESVCPVLVLREDTTADRETKQRNSTPWRRIFKSREMPV